MNIYDPVFTSAQVAKAAGMSHAKFRAHLSRGNWTIGSASKKAAALGEGHLFSIYDALGYALANALMSMGVDAKTAFDRAMLDFAHVGDTAYQGTTPIMRNPGDVFPLKHGMTIYSYVPGTARGECYATKITPDPLMFFSVNGGFAEQAIVIQLNLLRLRVFASLGFDARDYE